MRDPKLDILFEPLKMSNLTLKNRFFMAPIGTTFHMKQLSDFLAERAKGGVALITTGEICVHPGGRAGAGREEPRLETDDDIKVFSPLVKAVQNAGAKIIAQLNHAGRYSSSRALQQQPVAPSSIASRYTGEIPRELSTAETDDLIMAFAKAALRAKKAGFDGIEILGSSGYLISQFLSPVTNKRDDKYGGDTLKRATFLFSILKETRKRVGNDFNICVKFDAEDSMEGGRTLKDSILLAPHIVSAGADRLHIWAGWHEATRPMLPMFVKRGAFSHLAAEIKKVVDVPVSTVGRINDPYVAADILAKGEADLIGLGRTLLCDPDFVKKTSDGRTDEIRRCTACCYCFDQIMRAIQGDKKAGLKCSINPELGREGEGLIRPAEKKKNVVIVGGGPAGMEVARIASLRGHRVTLFEKDDKLGGLVNLAFIPPHKGELQNVVDYYVHQMEILPLKVRLSESFAEEEFERIKPDTLVFAAGARELMPRIPGITGEHVFTALEILKDNVPVKESVVVIGGGLIGVETAEFLADQGKKVTVIEMFKAVAADVGPTMRWGLLLRLSKKISMLTSTKVIEIKEKNVVVSDPENNRKEIPGDTVVIATGLDSRTDLVEQMKKQDAEVYMVGSCRKPGQIADAVEDAFAIGCKI
ncbi:MAG: FAD-dependent oxidoreductase [Deltaproteobacteria bacterium]|nr:FAD-dependent oxidoreductase [Deltaproteobacteria bacterium]